ncbi:Uncharacterised nucleotidyltransferase [Sphingomonas gellani]|uniref:Uncharacterized nucleotidyltransferase n=1 Tax=Sphingomonas gellani TaxID=1166340 RepID=A0A1H8FVZ8_9SPHN|nr:nucleotidyltransferase family protein [Sphingomonas gellani]SEN35896.1 Uncharacterised nucleotidyltransferase [Sphingomonas gellani]
MSAAATLVRVLRDPGAAATLDVAGWTGLIACARAEQLLGTLAWRVDGLALPAGVAPILADARDAAEAARRGALWEAEMARRALVPLGVPAILLKGTAFVAAGLAAGQGRAIGDLDLLVPRDAMAAVETALIDAGWEWVKPDPYDDAYYRRWMHELPPMIHRERDRMIDVHHTILPLTARRRPDAGALIAAAQPLGNGLSVLHPADMIVHAAAHLLADGDLAGGLRNLWDIDRLVREWDDPDAAAVLRRHAAAHNLADTVALALRLSHRLYGTPVDPALAGAARPSDGWFVRRLLARDGWGRPTRPATRLAFYVRSHWLRMPPAMLARHLWIKWLRKPPGA